MLVRCAIPRQILFKNISAFRAMINAPPECKFAWHDHTIILPRPEVRGRPEVRDRHEVRGRHEGRGNVIPSATY
jgi:hypothetical protein